MRRGRVRRTRRRAARSRSLGVCLESMEARRSTTPIEEAFVELRKYFRLSITRRDSTADELHGSPRLQETLRLWNVRREVRHRAPDGRTALVYGTEQQRQRRVRIATKGSVGYWYFVTMYPPK